MQQVFLVFKPILLNYIKEESVSILEKLWNEKSRFYHNVTHLTQIIKDIESSIWFKDLSLPEKHALVLAAFFHDAVYDPKKKDNEDKSIELFKQLYIGKDSIMSKKVVELIEITKHRKRPYKFLQRIFWDADNTGFMKGYDTLLKNEKLIAKEYKFVNKAAYKKGRIDFIKTNIGLFNSKVDKDLEKLILYCEKTY